MIASQWNSLLIEYQPISEKLSTNSWKSYLLFGAVQLYFLGNMTGHTISTLNTVHLKQLTKKNTIPLHRTDDVLEPLGGVQCVPLGTDRCEWNKRIVLRLPSQLIRAHKVQFQWRVMPFGSTNRPAIFIPFISIFHLVLIGLNWTHCLVYFDDITIRAPIFEDHINCLWLVFDNTRTAGFETEAYQASLP